ncbi:MAG: hypothetical protein H0T73_00560 [Ardenticatenales bacterium]|nr:hypothetical protein [Ardenticatenales bacterium]
MSQFPDFNIFCEQYRVAVETIMERHAPIVGARLLVRVEDRSQNEVAALHGLVQGWRELQEMSRTRSLESGVEGATWEPEQAEVLCILEEHILRSAMMITKVISLRPEEVCAYAVRWLDEFEQAGEGWCAAWRAFLPLRRDIFQYLRSRKPTYAKLTREIKWLTKLDGDLTISDIDWYEHAFRDLKRPLRELGQQEPHLDAVWEALTLIGVLATYRVELTRLYNLLATLLVASGVHTSPSHAFIASMGSVGERPDVWARKARAELVVWQDAQ